MSIARPLTGIWPAMLTGILIGILPNNPASAQPTTATTASSTAHPNSQDRTQSNLSTPAPTHSRIQLFPHITVDLNQSKVIIDSYVVASEDQQWLELIACTQGTREHEALIATLATPSQIHAALLSLGLQPGTPRRVEMISEPNDATTQTQSQNPGQNLGQDQAQYKDKAKRKRVIHPPTGPKLNLQIHIPPLPSPPPSPPPQPPTSPPVSASSFAAEINPQTNGQSDTPSSAHQSPSTRPIQDWIQIINLDQPSRQTPNPTAHSPAASSTTSELPSKPSSQDQTAFNPIFVFAGSYFYTNQHGQNRYAADAGGNVASLVQFGDEVIAHLHAGTYQDGHTYFQARSSVIPPIGTPVQLIIQPASQTPSPSKSNPAKLNSTNPNSTKPNPTKPQ